MAKTANELLAGLKRRVVIPSSQPLLSEADMLSLADDVTSGYMVPLISSVCQEYFVRTDDIALVSDQAEYDIPYRSVGRTLRDLKLKNSDGTVVRDLTQLAPEDAHLYRGPSDPFGYYFKNDKFVIVPTPTVDTWSVEPWWFCPPSRLVRTDQAGHVTVVADPMVTISSTPVEIAAGTVIDFIHGKSGNATITMDQTVTNVAANIVTFDPDVVPSDLAVGDWIAQAGYTPVIQLPNEAYPLLETKTAIRILNTIGDLDGAKVLEEDASREQRDLLKLLEPRNKGENQPIVNRKSLLRGRPPYWARRHTGTYL